MVANKDKRDTPKRHRSASHAHRPIPSHYRRMSDNVGPMHCGRCRTFTYQTKYFNRETEIVMYVCKTCNKINRVGRDYCTYCKKWLNGELIDTMDGKMMRCPRCRKQIKK